MKGSPEEDRTKQSNFLSGLWNSPTYLYGGFRQPGHSNKKFLLQVESSKMNEEEGDDYPDHQTDTDTGHTQS